MQHHDDRGSARMVEIGQQVQHFEMPRCGESSRDIARKSVDLPQALACCVVIWRRPWTFACGKKNPTLLEQEGVLEELMGQSGVSDVRNAKKPREGVFVMVLEILVAGAGFEPAAFRL